MSLEGLPDAPHVGGRRETLLEGVGAPARLIDATQLDERFDRDPLSLLNERAGRTAALVLADGGERGLRLARAELGVGGVDEHDVVAARGGGRAG